MADEKKITAGEVGELGWKFISPEIEAAILDDPALTEFFRRHRIVFLGGLGTAAAGLAKFAKDGSWLKGITTEVFGLALDVNRRLKEADQGDAKADKAEADYERFVKVLEMSLARQLDRANVKAYSKGDDAHLEICPDMPANRQGWQEGKIIDLMKGGKKFCKKCRLVTDEAKASDVVYVVEGYYHPDVCPYGETWKTRGYQQVDRARAVSLGLHRCSCHHPAKPVRNVRAEISGFFGDALEEYRRRNP